MKRSEGTKGIVKSEKMKTSFFHFFIFSFLLLLFACTKGLYTHEAARVAAEDYYSMLIKGNYKGFVNGYADAENMPEGFRSQLEDATAQFVADNMRSLVSVSAISDSLCEDSTAYVMLGLCFSDSTIEQIEVPLVLMENGWKMK
ncbi:MAG: hypothetical protein IKQ37_07275 [Bacteroidaceae bacterium]|nr:hypothetical protein [Bacteroidaceae bacterium]